MCLTLCDPMDCSIPGSSVHGIFQARILEWVAVSFSICNVDRVESVWGSLNTYIKYHLLNNIFHHLKISYLIGCSKTEVNIGSACLKVFHALCFTNIGFFIILKYYRNILDSCSLTKNPQTWILQWKKFHLFPVWLFWYNWITHD